jgi:non-ribosomal peptide synthase protein (TIGR01720 family)
VVHFDLGAKVAGRLLLVVHHLVVDGVSWSVLIEDMIGAYMQAAEDKPTAVPRRTASYRQWANRLSELAQTAEMRSQIGYWDDVLSVPVTSIPVDLTCAKNRVADACRVTMTIPVDETANLLREASHAHAASLQQMMLTSLTLALQRWTKQPVCRLDLEGHGREFLFHDADISRTVGWFTTIFPAVFDLTRCATLAEALAQVKRTLDAIPNRGIGYGILRYLSMDSTAVRPLRESPPAQILFNYVGQFPGAPSDSSPLQSALESVGQLVDAREERLYLLDILAVVRAGQLRVEFAYNRAAHRQETIEHLAADFIQILLQFAMSSPVPASGKVPDTQGTRSSNSSPTVVPAPDSDEAT